MEDYEIQTDKEIKVMLEKDLKPYKWVYESNYMGEDYSNYYVIYTHHRDSNIFETSNYESIREYLKEKNAVFEEITFTNWLVGWHESIMIEESQIDSLLIAIDIIKQLEGYPIFDEDDFSNRTIEKALEYWNDPYMVNFALQRINIYDHCRNNRTGLKTNEEIEESIGEYFEEIATE